MAEKYISPPVFINDFMQEAHKPDSVFTKPSIYAPSSYRIAEAIRRADSDGTFVDCCGWDCPFQLSSYPKT